jgi:hypothetical protein
MGTVTTNWCEVLGNQMEAMRDISSFKQDSTTFYLMKNRRLG